ncbi:MAG TPA: methyltransferase [Gemmatimonadaceae bacterium]|jgi:SAM-dependent methyltransferase
MTAAPESLARRAEPGRVTDAQSMAVLRELLADTGLTEEAVCARTGATSIYDFTSIREGRVPGQASDALDVLIRLFLDGDLMDRAVIRQHLPDRAVHAIEGLGLLGAPRHDASKQFATVLLYPTNNLWLISDLPLTAAGSPKPLSADAVYPAITGNTRDFLSSLPRTRCNRFLEMCGGTGIAALIASRFSTRAWTADITERSTRYARFNGELNNIDNFLPVQGDLYEPVRGLTFDRIVAHPPYIAAVEQTMIYRDGGPDGEQFTRALLRGLPEFLEPGGRYFMTCVATDRVNAPLEQRVREMIGDSNAEFDVVVAERATRDPVEYFRAVAKGGESTVQDSKAKIAAYAAIQAEKLVYASMAIERHASARTPFTARRSVGGAQIGAALEWQLDWVRLRESPEFAARMLDSRVHCLEGVQIRSDQRLVGGSWNVERLEVSVETPFRTSVECSAETAAILTRCTAPILLRDLARDLVADGLVGSKGVDAAVVSLASFFVNAGCLDTELLPAPATVK